MSKQGRYQINKNKYLLPPEVDRLEHLLKTYLEPDARNCLMLLVALYTGARATEVLNLRLQDINTYDQSLYIVGLKGSDDREIPLPEWIFTPLTQLEAKKERIFPISYNRLLQIWQLYRPVHKKFHSLRHTFAIQLYKKTKDLRLVQVALGHRNITNTMVYADYVYSKQELRKLIL